MYKTIGKTEIKSVDGLAGPVSPTVLGNITTMNICVIGSDNFNRLGKKISMKSVHIKGLWEPTYNNAAPNTGECMRCIVIYDRQTNKAVPTLGDLFSDYGSTGVVGNSFFANINLANRDRFSILSEWHQDFMPIGINGAVSASTIILEPQTLFVNKFIKLNRLETVYNANNSVIADINTGGLYLVIIALLATAGNNNVAWQFNFNQRLRFYDN